MFSMTGYGHGIYKANDYTVDIELKSVNSRFLEIYNTTHPLLSSYELYVNNRIKECAKRGHIEVYMRLDSISSGTKVNLDEPLLMSYMNALERVRDLTEAPLPSVIDYALLSGVLNSEDNRDETKYQEGVEKALNIALSSFVETKESDGNGTKDDLYRLGKEFSSALDEIKSKKEGLEAHFKSLLLTKYDELKIEKGIDDPRFMSEVAALLVKYSINEECQRLTSHLKEYFRLLELNEPVGKRLDFLSQEMNREVNTIASKSQMVEVNLLVVNMKDKIEDIREQIRNIE